MYQMLVWWRRGERAGRRDLVHDWGLAIAHATEQGRVGCTTLDQVEVNEAILACRWSTAMDFAHTIVNIDRFIARALEAGLLAPLDQDQNFFTDASVKGGQFSCCCFPDVVKCSVNE